MEALWLSPEWQQAERVIAAQARRGSPKWLCEDVVSEARCRLMEHLAKGATIDNLRGFAMTVVQSVVREIRARERVQIAAPDEVELESRPPSFDELVARPGLPLGFLRGAVQKRLVAQVTAGMGLEAISASLGFSIRETKRQVLRLAEWIRARRKSAEICRNPRLNCHKRTPSG
ncbi:MAG: sigma-70 family RNA polymerase sigma factor [Planctomycetes bacterium]|nr:sigma-70 family RNA polymerase sigma factor [Planctomycetota bacterium]